jgi:hypothetical protein
MRAVLDANVFVRAILEPRGQPARVLDAWRAGVFDVAVCNDIIAEVREVLRRPRLRRRHGWSDEQISEFLALLREVAVVTTGEIQVKAVAGDPDDDMYLACALEAGADYVVSGDDHLRVLGSYRGVAILSARQFLAALAE